MDYIQRIQWLYVTGIKSKDTKYMKNSLLSEDRTMENLKKLMYGR